MKCSLRSRLGARVSWRSGSRPHVELLESRLQPGSVVTGQGIEWSLLVESLAFLDQGSLAPESLVSQTLSESHKPAQPSDINVFDIHTATLPVAGPSVAAARTDTAHHEGTAPAARLTNGSPAWLNDQLALLAAGGRTNVAPVAKVTPANPTLTAGRNSRGIGQASSLARNQNTPQTVAVPLAAPVKLDAQLVALPALHSGPQVQVTTTHTGGGPVTQSAPAWASYLGFSLDDRLRGITMDPTSAPQPLVVAGFSQNPNDATEYRAIIARFGTDGTSATVATLGFGSNSRLELHAVVVGASGDIFVAGQATVLGATTDLIASVKSDLSAPNWSLAHNPMTTATANGVNLDATSTTLYVSGAVDGNTVLTVLTDLGNPMPTVVFSVGIHFDAGDSVGNGVAPDSIGNADLAIMLKNGANTLAVVAQISADGTTLNWPAKGFNSTGPKGGMNAVFVDASDNIFLTGGIGVSNPPFLDEVIEEFGSSGTFLNGIRINARNGGEIVGYSVQTDAAGNVFTAVTVSGTDLIGKMAFIEVDPTLTRIVEAPNPNDPNEGDGTAFGALDDQTRGLVLDQADSALFLVGFTNSTDFNLTANTYQPTYGGGTWDGVVIRYNVF